ncbi:hypothetical protein ACPTJB_30855, partial [Pseudomonas aeruginosa]
LQQLPDKLLQPQREDLVQYALVLVFLGTRYDQLAATLARFKALLPVPDLQPAERRAASQARLELEKRIMHRTTPGPRWQDL